MGATIQRALVYGLLALLTSGCPRNLDFGGRGQITDPALLLAALKTESALIRTVHGDAKLQLDSPQGSGALAAYLWVARPDLIHLELLDFFGKPQSVLTVNGARFGLYQAQEGRYYSGPATPANLARFLPLVMAGEELALLMLGEPTPLPDAELGLDQDLDAGAYRLTARAAHVTQRLWVHPRFLRATRAEVQGAHPFTATFGNLQPVGVSGAGVFPRTLTLEAPSSRTRVELRYTDVKFNHPADPALFELRPPEGIPLIEVDGDFRPQPPPT